MCVSVCVCIADGKEGVKNKIKRGKKKTTNPVLIIPSRAVPFAGAVVVRASTF